LVQLKPADVLDKRLLQNALCLFIFTSRPTVALRNIYNDSKRLEFPENKPINTQFIEFVAKLF